MSSRDRSPDLNEQSPLISPQVSAEASEDLDVEDNRLSQSFNYDETAVESKSSWYLFLLTLSIGGLQIVWSVELSNGSPYLLSLGMSKSLLAFVWIAGPLSGALVQPYIGIRSDNCRLSWGKRRPFMIGGGAATIVALLALAWTREMVQGGLGLFGVASDSNGTKIMTIVVGTLFMYLLDISINTGKPKFWTYVLLLTSIQYKPVFARLLWTMRRLTNKKLPMPGHRALLESAMSLDTFSDISICPGHFHSSAIPNSRSFA